MTDLSPAAQAVRDAALATHDKSNPMDDLRQASADVSGVEVLSPAAQAVDRAVADRIQLLGEIAPSRQIAAAALRAAALHIDDASDGLECQDILRQIAAELEGAGAA